MYTIRVFELLEDYTSKRWAEGSKPMPPGIYGLRYVFEDGGCGGYNYLYLGNDDGVLVGEDWLETEEITPELSDDELTEMLLSGRIRIILQR